MDLAKSVGKENPATQPLPACPLRLPVGGIGVQGGGMYVRPKESNAAVGVRDRATGKVPEEPDRETDSLYVPYSKILQM